MIVSEEYKHDMIALTVWAAIFTTIGGSIILYNEFIGRHLVMFWGNLVLGWITG